MAKTPDIPKDKELAKEYIFEVSRGLVKVAKDHDIEFLAYLLEMAALAAAAQSPGNDT